MLTFKHAFNSKNSSGYLGSCHEKPFLLPLISNKLFSGCVMVQEWVINELFPCLPKFSPKWSVCVCLPGVLSKEKKRGWSPRGKEQCIKIHWENKKMRMIKNGKIDTDTSRLDLVSPPPTLSDKLSIRNCSDASSYLLSEATSRRSKNSIPNFRWASLQPSIWPSFWFCSFKANSHKLVVWTPFRIGHHFPWSNSIF